MIRAVLPFVLIVIMQPLELQQVFIDIQGTLIDYVTPRGSMLNKSICLSNVLKRFMNDEIRIECKVDVYTYECIIFSVRFLAS